MEAFGAATGREVYGPLEVLMRKKPLEAKEVQGMPP